MFYKKHSFWVIKVTKKEIIQKLVSNKDLRNDIGPVQSCFSSFQHEPEVEDARSWNWDCSRSKMTGWSRPGLLHIPTEKKIKT